jgi:hypothetical protein
MANTYTSNFRFREPATGDANYDDEWYHNQEMKEMLVKNTLDSGNPVVAGLVVTATSGLGVTWTGGVVYVGNTLYSVVAGSATLTGSPSPNYYTPVYVYVNDSGVVSNTQNMVTSDMSLMAIVDVSQSSVIAISDARKMQETTLTAKPPAGVELTGNVTGLILSPTSGYETARIDVSAGSCLDSTGTYQMILSSLISKRIRAAWSVGDGAGGMLDHAVAPYAADTLYNIYLIWKDEDGSVDVGFIADARSIGSYYPTGYSAHRWIGFVVTDSSSNIRGFTHTQLGFMYDSIYATSLTFTNNTYQEKDMTAFIPAVKTQKVVISGKLSTGGSDGLDLSLSGTEDEQRILISTSDPTVEFEDLPSLNVTNAGTMFMKSQTGGGPTVTIWIKSVEIVR